MKEKPQRLRPRLVRGLSDVYEPTLDYPIRPVSIKEVQSVGGFWGVRLDVHRRATLPHAWEKLRHNIENFHKAAGKREGAHQGLHWDDSDLYKVMEGAAYLLTLRPEAELEAYLEGLIEAVAAAQEPDGYLYTARTIDPANPAPGAGPNRWSFLPGSHELYCMGHMIEAAVAHHESTGRRSFLNVALLAARMIEATFGEGKRRDVDGHQEIELALARLYRVTGDPRFLRSCRYFLDERGRHDLRESYTEAEQDHLPVLEQKEPAGHAVRATYMYAAMTDVAAMQDDPAHAKASKHLWEEVVTKRIALTGAVGPHHEGEAFGEPYVLPNLDPHNETCATVGMMLWSHRLFLLTGEGKYLDVMERSLYNAYLASHSLEGTAFFYCNPLEARDDGTGKSLPKRPDWQGCACCPTNVARITPQVPAWAYAVRDSTVYVTHYVNGIVTLDLLKGRVRLAQETRYPWDGEIRIALDLETEEEYIYYDLALRIPGWAQGRPLPGDLYRYEDAAVEPVTLTVNVEPVPVKVEKGFAMIRRVGRPGDRLDVRLTLPMPVRRVLPHEAIEDCRGKAALERGPLVYCVEGIDHGGSVESLLLPDTGDLTVEHGADFLGGVTVLRGRDFSALPYYAWNNRGPGEMKVWLPLSNTDVYNPVT